MSIPTNHKGSHRAITRKKRCHTTISLVKINSHSLKNNFIFKADENCFEKLLAYSSLVMFRRQNNPLYLHRQHQNILFMENLRLSMNIKNKINGNLTCDNLSTSALAIFGSFNNPWQIQKLYAKRKRIK